MTNTNELNAVVSQVLVVVDTKVIGIVDCWEDAQDEVASHFENASEGSLDNSTVTLYNFVDTMESGSEFKVKVNSGELMIGEEAIGNVEEEFRLVDGSYQGMTFNDKDDLEEFFKEKIKSGDLDLEEVQNTEVVRTVNENWSFEDAELDDNEYTLVVVDENMTHRALGYGQEYVPASEAHALQAQMSTLGVYTTSIDEQVQERIKKELNDADLVNVRRNLQDMTLVELNEELNTLQKRVSAIHSERKARKRLEDGNYYNPSK